MLVPGLFPGAIVAAFVCSAALQRSCRSRRGVAALLWGLCAFHVVDAAFAHYYHRPFRVLLDLPLLPESVRLLVSTDGIRGALVPLAFGLVLLLLLLPGLAALLVGVQSAAAALGDNGVRAGLSLALVGSGLASDAWIARDAPLPLRLLEEARFSLDFPLLQANHRRRFEAQARLLRGRNAGFEGLGGLDFSVIFIESYGRGALEGPDGTVRQVNALGQFQRRLDAAQLAVSSVYVEAPTYGGGSWFAHATFATGLKIWEPVEYALLLKSAVLPLSALLGRAGYETYNVAPGTTRPWPEGVFFGFEHSLTAKDFPYRGPRLGWGHFPDQYVLDHVGRNVARRDRPIYKELKLVSSHVPWREVPTAIPDWESVGDGDIYHRWPVKRFDIRWSSLKGAEAAYEAAIAYDLDVVSDYIARFEANSGLVLVLGDHQPVREATGSESWDVPVHAVGPRHLVDRLRPIGFRRGLRPGREAALAMDEMLLALVDVLSTSAASP